ncbi:hypothetical protein, partial [Achromobacter ruhlandii]|uniref:hypothetical protein n=1 Tax=Achromobacter ruhlandii TaxID=72557 RepID=UPI0022B9070D
QKTAIIAQVGQIYSDAVGQYYIGADNWGTSVLRSSTRFLLGELETPHHQQKPPPHHEVPQGGCHQVGV